MPVFRSGVSPGHFVLGFVMKKVLVIDMHWVTTVLVGADHSSWPTCLGHFGIGNMNENGQRLLELCCYHSLSITNTFFITKPQHKVPWRHPRSKHWHQLDLVLTRCINLGNVKLTRSYQSADCDTDHTLVCCKVNFKAKRVHHTKKEGRHCINTCMARRSENVKEFIRLLEEAFGKKQALV